jgi:hypothetical protein
MMYWKGDINFVMAVWAVGCWLFDFYAGATFLLAILFVRSNIFWWPLKAIFWGPDNKREDR